MVPERKNPRYSEKGIQAAIAGSMLEGIPQISQNQYRRTYRPYKKHPKYKGFLALYVHYLYILGKVQKHQYPPRMTAHLRQEAAKFERYREQFRFLADHGIETEAQMTEYITKAEDRLKSLTKQRTILNVQKKRRQRSYRALADTELLAPVRRLYEEGLSGMEEDKILYASVRDKTGRDGGLRPKHQPASISRKSGWSTGETGDFLSHCAGNCGIMRLA